MSKNLAAALLLIILLQSLSPAQADQAMSLSCNEKPTIPGSCQPYTNLVGTTTHSSVLFFIRFQYDFALHNFEVNVSGVQRDQTASVLLTPHRRALYLNFTPGVRSYRETWSSVDFCPATPDDITGCNIVPVILDLLSGPTAPSSALKLCVTDLTQGASSCIDLQFPSVDYVSKPNYALILTIIAVGAVAEAAWLFYARRPR